MKKPEILKGNVKEFVGFDVYKLDRVTKGNEPHTDLRRIQMFYSQPFKPEMITEYFENIIKDSYGEYWIDWEDRGHKVYKNGKVAEYKYRAKTLSQFISNCIQAGINLNWK